MRVTMNKETQSTVFLEYESVGLIRGTETIGQSASVSLQIFGDHESVLAELPVWDVESLRRLGGAHGQRVRVAISVWRKDDDG